MNSITSVPNSKANINMQRAPKESRTAERLAEIAAVSGIAIGVSTKALSKSGLKLTDLFKSNNIGKFAQNFKSVASATLAKPANTLIKGVAKILPNVVKTPTSTSGLLTALGAILTSAAINLVGKIVDLIVDFCAAKAKNALTPKTESVTKDTQEKNEIEE